MFWFRKSPQPLPQIIVGELTVTLHPQENWWQFFYHGVEFIAFQRSFVLPACVELDSMLRTVDELLPELRERLRAGSTDHGITVVEGPLQLSIDLSAWTETQTFSVTPGGGPDWGDLGATFLVRHGAIVEEIWLD